MNTRKHKREDKWIAPFFKQYRGALILALCLGIMSFVFASALMFSSGYLISKAAEAPGNIMVIFVPIALVRVFGIGKPILRYLERLTSHNWVLKMTSSLRLKLYNTLEKTAMALKQQLGMGDILGLLAEDVGHTQNLYLRSIFPFIVSLVLYTLVVGILGFFSIWFALCMLLLLGIVVVLVPLVSALTNGARQTKRKLLNEELYTKLTDNVMGVSDWIIAGREEEHAQSYKASEQDLRRIDHSLRKSSYARNMLLQIMYGIIVVALILWAGSYFGGAGTATANWIAAFVLAFFPLIEAFAPLPDAAVEMYTHRASIDNLNDLSRQSKLVPEAQHAAVKPTCHPELDPGSMHTAVNKQVSAPCTLSVDNLSFAYPQSKHPVFKDVNLQIPPGQKLAVLGRSGAGKSTLASLLRGDLAPSAGSVTLNNVPTNELGDTIAHSIGVIQQQTYLFNATLAENLRIGKPSASDEDLWEVLERVGLKSLVERLPKGLETLADEAGLRFSGGERHRFALARVLLHDVPIIILDEPTVGLDPLTEQALLHTIFKTLADKTIILITHHLKGVALADKVIFIEDGGLKLEGCPAELAKHNPYYQKLQAFDTGISRKGYQ